MNEHLRLKEDMQRRAGGEARTRDEAMGEGREREDYSKEREWWNLN